MVDGFLTRSVYRKPYQSGLQPNVVSVSEDPEITDAQFFLGTRFKIERLSGLLGIGTIIEKYNLPYSLDEDVSATEISGRTNVRLSGTRLAMLFGANYGFKRLSFGLRIPYSQWNGKKYLSVHSYAMYRMSKTWAGGFDLIATQADSLIVGAPSVKYTGVGLFLGIQLGR